MTEIIDVIKDWPIIVQGALGSALFWVFLFIGQAIANQMATAYSWHSKNSRISWLVSTQAKYTAHISKSPTEIYNIITGLTYRSLRPFYRAVMWLTLGLIANSIFNPFGIVGFIGCLYYLFKAYEVIGPVVDSKENVEIELKKIMEEIKEKK